MSEHQNANIIPIGAHPQACATEKRALEEAKSKFYDACRAMHAAEDAVYERERRIGLFVMNRPEVILTIWRDAGSRGYLFKLTQDSRIMHKGQFQTQNLDALKDYMLTYRLDPPWAEINQGQTWTVQTSTCGTWREKRNSEIRLRKFHPARDSGKLWGWQKELRSESAPFKLRERCRLELSYEKTDHQIRAETFRDDVKVDSLSLNPKQMTRIRSRMVLANRVPLKEILAGEKWTCEVEFTQKYAEDLRCRDLRRRDRERDHMLLSMPNLNFRNEEGYRVLTVEPESAAFCALTKVKAGVDSLMLGNRQTRDAIKIRRVTGEALYWIIELWGVDWGGRFEWGQLVLSVGDVESLKAWSTAGKARMLKLGDRKHGVKLKKRSISSVSLYFSGSGVGCFLSLSWPQLGSLVQWLELGIWEI